MDISKIDTKAIYRAANVLSGEARKIYADIEKAREFMHEGFITEEQYAAIDADRSKKLAPYEDGASLLSRFARAVDAQNAPDNCMTAILVANTEPVDSFDIAAVKSASRLAFLSIEPMLP